MTLQLKRIFYPCSLWSEAAGVPMDHPADTLRLLLYNHGTLSCEGNSLSLWTKRVKKFESVDGSEKGMGWGTVKVSNVSCLAQVPTFNALLIIIGL